MRTPLPQLDYLSPIRDFQEEFKGYNHNLRIAENEFYDMKNMSGDYFPVLSPRKKRGYEKDLAHCSAMICKDALCYIDYGHLYINDYEIAEFQNTVTSISGNSTEHVMIGMGAYLVIFKKTDNGLEYGWYINTENYDDYGYIDQRNAITLQSGGSETIGLSNCTIDGGPLTMRTSSSPPSNPANGDLWLDTSGDVHYIKKWSAAQGMWVSLSTTYVKISAPNIGVGLEEGDAVQLSHSYVNDGRLIHVNGLPTGTATGILKTQIEALGGTTIVQSRDDNWIVVIGILDETMLLENMNITVYVSRQAPYMDYICESNNRLWGCRYGLNREGNVVNEIYACKQGDFKNWFCYAGISTDSYAASVGSDDVWTGCIAYGNYVLFFKENCIHKLFGNMPSNYQLIESKVRGVQRGSYRSLCIVNEVLFYKSSTDFCYYDGSLPVGISNALGEIKYRNAVCGAVNSKLYVNMQDPAGEWVLFVYDLNSGLWHKHDNIHCTHICRVDTDLYFTEEHTGEYEQLICTLNNFTGSGTLESDFEWYAETGVIGYSLSDNKYVSKILVRLQKPIRSQFRLYIKYDDSLLWEPVTEFGGEGTSSKDVSIIPKRCDHFRLRFEGKGECKVFSLSKTIRTGSDRF